MTAPDTLRLEIGSSRGLRLWHDGLALLAAAGLLTAGVHPQALLWSLAALAVAWVVSRWRLARASLRGSLQLRRDGTATLFGAGKSRELSLLDSWISPWLCVLHFEGLPDAGHYRAVVCRSRNTADAWRQLRVRLRSGRTAGATA